MVNPPHPSDFIYQIHPEFWQPSVDRYAAWLLSIGPAPPASSAAPSSPSPPLAGVPSGSITPGIRRMRSPSPAPASASPGSQPPASRGVGSYGGARPPPPRNANWRDVSMSNIQVAPSRPPAHTARSYVGVVAASTNDSIASFNMDGPQAAYPHGASARAFPQPAPAPATSPAVHGPVAAAASGAYGAHHPSALLERRARARADRHPLDPSRFVDVSLDESYVAPAPVPAARTPSPAGFPRTMSPVLAFPGRSSSPSLGVGLVPVQISPLPIDSWLQSLAAHDDLTALEARRPAPEARRPALLAPSASRPAAFSPPREVWSPAPRPQAPAARPPSPRPAAAPRQSAKPAPRTSSSAAAPPLYWQLPRIPEGYHQYVPDTWNTRIPVTDHAAVRTEMNRLRKNYRNAHWRLGKKGARPPPMCPDWCITGRP